MQGEHFCLEYRAEGLESICGVPDSTRPAIPSGPHRPYLRFCYRRYMCGPTMASRSIVVGSRSSTRTRARMCAGCGNSQKRGSRAPVGTYVSNVFRALPHIARLLLTLMSRGQP
ncbi:hypothetical protein EVAR_65714_1 [Eumeta japonica]|uniref:Uncharacterized protein n=1 Tax=Eumeta variegata TaxID=151549 RepID=A0A4C2AAZ6_EUMVA|nr:hypothetical protein EVAR_65714_1 [Eumeta japonica]